MLCPSCDSENGETRKFCRSCGTALAPVCHGCGAANDPGDRFCGECGASLTAPLPSPPQSLPPQSLPIPATEPNAYLENEERRPVTVLFADIVGFTALSERLDAESVREITTDCFRRLVPVVARFEGTVDKFIGDAIMVLFGAPIAHEDDPARAVQSALAMLEALADFNRDLQAAQGFTLALRMGVESGEVVAGLRDVAGVSEYTVIGDAVNTAARLQSATEPGSILVGPRAHQATGTLFTFREVPPLSLKGKAEPIHAWVVEDRQPPASRAAVQPRSPLVGRAQELEVLERCLSELGRGRGQIALVMGEAGLGKSRLLRELHDRHPSVNWRRCQAFAHERDVSYGLARAATRDLFDLDAYTADDSTLERLRGRLGAINCSASLPALAYLLGVSAPGQGTAQLDQLDAQELQREIFGAVARVIERLAREQPLVFELDDLQWADPTSIELLLAALDLTERAPVFFCLAFRPERDAPAWTIRERSARDFPHRYAEVLLQPLDAASSGELAAQLLGTTQLPPELITVLERAAGTPLWLEELVQTLIERGLLVEVEGQWRLAADIEHVEIPNTLQALIVARIDRLGEARTTLQTASVIGREFPHRVLAQVAEDNRRLDDHLLHAQRVDLVREMATIPEREYGFKHVLTQEAAYGTLLLRRRRDLHRRVAEAIESLYPDRLDELHPVLARHFSRAEAWDRALHHARRAAVAARGAYANREAIEHLGVAIEAAEHLELAPRERIQLLEMRAEARAVLGLFDEARADYEAALAIGDAAESQPDRARLLAALGMLWGGHKDYARGMEYMQQATTAAELAGEATAVARAQVGLGVMLLNLSRMDESRRVLERALEVYRGLSDPAGIAQTLDVLGMACGMGGDLEAALRYSEEAMTQLRAIGDRLTEASSAAVHGVIDGYRGNRAEAERWIRFALETFGELEAQSGMAFALLTLAQVSEPFGRYQAAQDAVERGLSIARAIDHREWTQSHLGRLGRIARVCGDLESAERYGREALAIAEQLGAIIWVALGLGDLGSTTLARGDAIGSTTYFDRAIQLGGESDAFIVEAHLGRAEALLQLGRERDALAAARRFLDVSRAYGVFSIDARRIEGLALERLGDAANAERSYRVALREAQALDVLPGQWRAAIALADLLMATQRPEEALPCYSLARETLEAVASQLTTPALRLAFAASAPMLRVRSAGA